MKYVKTVVVEAFQWTNEPNNFSSLVQWSNNRIRSASPLIWKDRDVKMCLEITLGDGGGVLLANLNDWIIKDEYGYFYTCTPDWFKKTYQPA